MNPTRPGKITLRVVSARVVAMSLALLAASSGAQEGPVSEPTYEVAVRYNLMVPMRDGTHLSTDVYRPDAEGRFPAILVRDPYDNGSGRGYPDRARFFASRGYVFLHQDVRGRNDSEGSFFPGLHEANDGFDTLEWIAAQPWSNGRVGMVGGSYLGTAQWRAASTRSRHLKAIVPLFASIDTHRAGRPGGAVELGRIQWAAGMDGRTLQPFEHDWKRVIWHLPLISLDERLGHDLPLWKSFFLHAEDAAFWKPLDLRQHLPHTEVAALIVGGWYDPYIRSVLFAYDALASRDGHGPRQRLVIGPWRHGNSGRTTGEIDFGPAAQVDLNRLTLRWLDFHLKGLDNGIDREPPVHVFVMGENRWRRGQEWPLSATVEKYYLRSGGSANGLDGDGELATEPAEQEEPDRFLYDPRDPVPTRGGSAPGASTGLKAGPIDQREVEAREDVLIYTSPALAEDLEVTGPVKVTLYASSTAPDTDFTAKLVDVYPDGRAYNLADGIVRARYRQSLSSPQLLEPGQVNAFEIDLGATSNVFKGGHRIRLEISSSNFPRFDRNQNTGKPMGLDDQLETAEQTVHHDRRYPSHIALPVVRP
jgi:putative CocE/NonD family hydrolase